MRETYRQQLGEILTELEHMTWIVANAVRRSTSALLEANIRKPKMSSQATQRSIFAARRSRSRYSS